MGSALVRKRRGSENVPPLSESVRRESTSAAVNGLNMECGGTTQRETHLQENGGTSVIMGDVVLRRPSRVSGQYEKTRRHSIGTPGDIVVKDGLIEERATAAYKLRLLLQQLENGDMPSSEELQKSLSFAADVLSQQNDEEKSGEDKLLRVRDQQVRAWLSTTFTTRDSRYLVKTNTLQPRDRFKAVANTIMISKFIGSITKEQTPFTEPQYPEQVADIFHNQLDSWGFDIFRVESLCPKQTLRFVGYELFKRHDLFKRCEISPAQLDCFLSKVEAGYGNHGNPYHNSTHGADVAQTVHYLIHSTGFESYLSSLEVLSLLLAAIIHDVDHPGTSNSFQITERLEYAMLYNDRAVLENHHLYYSFKLLREDDCNFLRKMSTEDFRLLRKLVIDMVLATDMSLHFEQVKQMRHLLSTQDAGTNLLGADRSKMFCILMHMADISHPGKPWQQHYEWTQRLCEEFFRQGDREKKLSRAPSPLCDRENTNIPESQIGFIDFIVEPSYKVCQDMLELCFSQPLQSSTQSNCDGSESHDSTVQSHDCIVQSHDLDKFKVWEDCLTNNRQEWQSKCEDTDKESGDLNNIDASKHQSDPNREQNDRSDTSRHCRDQTNHTRDHSDTDKDQNDCTDTSRDQNDTSRDQNDHSDSSSDHSGKTRDQKTERVECKKHSLVELQTISTVETLQTPGGSETKTLRTVEYCKVTTNEATLIQSQCNHQESS